MKIYVASSWRNDHQPLVVWALRREGHDVYDFRNPVEGDYGFQWSNIDPEWQSWTPEAFVECLQHPVAQSGFDLDWQAMEGADVCVLVMPCGRSAHIEAGYFVGHPRKRLIILLTDGEPELMYKMGDAICTDFDQVDLRRSPQDTA